MIRILILTISSSLLFSCTYYLGPNRWAKSFPENPVIVPQELANEELAKDGNYLMNPNDLQAIANKKLKTYSTKYSDTTLDARVVYAKLILNQDIEYVNQTIKEFEAWGTTGTSSKLNKIGDYDFRQIIFVDIIGQFKDSPEVLYPSTMDHMIDKLIIDNGSKPAHKAPKVMGLIRETENHILMKETSRYLKNQWLFEKYPMSEYNNEVNGMKDFLIEHLTEMIKTGFFEFNANPYISFTFEALHVLHKHTNDEEIKQLTKKVLDAENWQYALGSYQLKKYGPFRRRMGRASETSLFNDRHGTLIRMELAKSHQTSINSKDLPCCFDKSLILGTSPYQLPEQTLAMIEEKPSAYYAKIGHGLKATPEIYFGTPDYLLSAGGIRFGKRSQITPRPLSLFLNDGASDIAECFHIPGKGKLNNWNNTGVYHQLMVGNQAVHIPTQYQSIGEKDGWKIFQPYSDLNLFVCTFSQENLGLIYVGQTYEDVLSLNLNAKKLKHEFAYSKDEKISYRLNTKQKWVITKTPDGKVVRKVKKWKRFDVNFSPTL